MENKLTPKVLQKIKADYTQEEALQVSECLCQYGMDKPEAERVHLGILEVANGDLTKLETLTALALTDYRDVLNQAEYLNDPYNIMQTLLRDLIATHTFTPEEVTETMRATGGTNYRKAFEFLVSMIPQRGKILTRGQYQLVDKLGRSLKLPVKTWKHLAK